MSTSATARTWFSTAQAAQEVGKNKDTVLKALESGELHGGQRKKKGHWRIHVDCLTAWAFGSRCAHQKTQGSAA